jgi:type IV secretion system protein VirD4
VLGTRSGQRGRRTGDLLATEPLQSLAVIGPTQSGKTSGLAIPAILHWAGPVLAASVKTDLVRDTLARRAELGRVWCFDPMRVTTLAPAAWSPLRLARTWAGARRVAANLTEVTRGPSTSADGEFWYATAAKLLAPLLFAAARSGRSMTDVVRWVDTQEVLEILEVLEGAGEPAALHAAQASWQREDRQRSSVYTTLETVLEPFGEVSPDRGRRQDVPDVDPEALLDGVNTLYLCAPAHDQRRLRGLFTAVCKDVVETAFERSLRSGQPGGNGLLVVLDEAANIASPEELDGLASTCAGHGVQLVTVWQDLAQIQARYGTRADTVLNNHRARLFLSGTADGATLDRASHLVGEEEVHLPSLTTGPGGDSTTSAPTRRPLLPPDALRRLPANSGVLIYGSLPPVRVNLRPWWVDNRAAAHSGRGRRSRP